MLPLPGAPSTSWAMYQSRLRSMFTRGNVRVYTAFWLFGKRPPTGARIPKPASRPLPIYHPALDFNRSHPGLINNVLYVIILSAALDLVGPSVPKGVVLLADVVPSFVAKLFVPYFIHKVPYAIRILFFVSAAAFSMILIALTPAATDGASVAAKMMGVMLASLVSGCGELSFLGLTHYYGQSSLAAWGSGTGGAGLLGAGAYAIATNVLKLSVKNALLASSFLPIVMLMAFFVVLPRGPLQQYRYNSLKERSEPASPDLATSHVSSNEADDDVGDAEREGLLGQSSDLAPSRNDQALPSSSDTFQKKLQLVQKLFFPL